MKTKYFFLTLVGAALALPINQSYSRSRRPRGASATPSGGTAGPRTQGQDIRETRSLPVRSSRSIP